MYVFEYRTPKYWREKIVGTGGAPAEFRSVGVGGQGNHHLDPPE